MIKLICPECQSDHINCYNSDCFEAWFECEECGSEFTLKESRWEYDNYCGEDIPYKFIDKSE